MRSTSLIGGADWDLHLDQRAWHNGLQHSFVEQWSPQDADQRRAALAGDPLWLGFGFADRVGVVLGLGLG